MCCGECAKASRHCDLTCVTSTECLGKNKPLCSHLRLVQAHKVKKDQVPPKLVMYPFVRLVRCGGKGEREGDPNCD